MAKAQDIDDPLIDAEKLDPEGPEAVIQDVLADLGDTEFSLRIRKKSTKGKWAYIGSFAGSEFSIDGIKDEFGGGDYAADILNEKGKYQRRVNFSIDAKIKGNIERPPTIAQINPMDFLNPLLSKQGEDTKLMMEMSNKSADSTMKMMMLMMQQSQTQMQGMMQMFVALIGSKNSGGDNDIDKLIKMKMLFPDTTDKALEMFSRGMEIGNNKTPDPWWKELASCVAPALVPMLTGGKVTLDPEKVAMLQSETSPEEPKNNEEMLKLLAKAKELASYVEQSAIFKKDVAEVANKLVVEVDAIGFLDKSIQFLHAPNWFEALIAKNPNAKTHEVYLKSLRDEIVKITSDEQPTVTHTTYL